MESEEAGYVLFDVLVGMAIAGLVMLAAVMGFRQLYAVQDRLRAEAVNRSEALAIIRLIRSQLDGVRPDTRPNLVKDPGTGNEMLAFTGTLSAPALADPAIEVRIRISDEKGRGGNAVIELERLDVGFRAARLSSFPIAVSFRSRNRDEATRFPDFGLAINPGSAGGETVLPFSVLAKTRPLCIAAPFEPSCRN